MFELGLGLRVVEVTLNAGGFLTRVFGFVTGWPGLCADSLLFCVWMCIFWYFAWVVVAVER